MAKSNTALPKMLCCILINLVAFCDIPCCILSYGLLDCVLLWYVTTCYAIWFCTVPYFTRLVCYTVLYRTVLCYRRRDGTPPYLYFTVLYYIFICIYIYKYGVYVYIYTYTYYTVFHYTVLHYTVL